jgi:hypothetical protein
MYEYPDDKHGRDLTGVDPAAPPPYRAYTVTPSYTNPDLAFYVVQAPDEPAVTVSWDPAWQATPYVCLAHPLAGTPGTPACDHIQAVITYRAAQEGSGD